MLSLYLLLTLISAAFAKPMAALAPRAGKPSGGPGFATLTVWSGNTFHCTNINSVIPTDGSAGTSQTVTITEDACVIINVPSTALFSASITQAPKTGVLGCWVQLYTQGGCGFTTQNTFWGQPIPGTAVGTKLGCASPPMGFSFGGAELLCL